MSHGGGACSGFWSDITADVRDKPVLQFFGPGFANPVGTAVFMKAFWRARPVLRRLGRLAAP